MNTIEIRHFHAFVSLDDGAHGFNNANPRIGTMRVKFRCIDRFVACTSVSWLETKHRSQPVTLRQGLLVALVEECLPMAPIAKRCMSCRQVIGFDCAQSGRQDNAHNHTVELHARKGVSSSRLFHQKRPTNRKRRKVLGRAVISNELVHHCHSHDKVRCKSMFSRAIVSARALREPYSNTKRDDGSKRLDPAGRGVRCEELGEPRRPDGHKHYTKSQRAKDRQKDSVIGLSLHDSCPSAIGRMRCAARDAHSFHLLSVDLICARHRGAKIGRRAAFRCSNHQQSRSSVKIGDQSLQQFLPRLSVAFEGDQAKRKLRDLHSNPVNVVGRSGDPMRTIIRKWRQSDQGVIVRKVELRSHQSGYAHELILNGLIGVHCFVSKAREQGMSPEIFSSRSKTCRYPRCRKPRPNRLTCCRLLSRVKPQPKRDDRRCSGPTRVSDVYPISSIHDDPFVVRRPAHRTRRVAEDLRRLLPAKEA